MNDDQQIGFGGGDDDDMPPEMREHMLAAFAHHAGLGPHPGKYKGPPRKQRPPDDITDTDRQRAEEEPIEGEASAAKMHSAQMGAPEAAGQSLGPSAMDQAQIKQRGAMSQQAATKAAQQAAQAQAAQAPVNAPPAPSGPLGSTIPFPAQKGAVGGGGNVQQPSQSPAPPAPGPQAPDQEEEQGPPQ